MYKINYHTGAGDKEVDGSLRDAMRAADAGAAYTQQNISIEDENGNEVAFRPWCGTTAEIEDQQNPIQFGSFGYYGDWQEF